MVNYRNQIKILIQRIVFVYFIYALCRLAFLIINKRYFEVSAGESFKLFFYGLRFDSFSICISNSLFIILSSLPSKYTLAKGFRTFMKWLFILSNSLFILLNCVDFVYYSFIKKRSTSDLFYQVFGGQTKVANQIPYYLRDFWYVFLIFGVFVFLLLKVYNKTESIKANDLVVKKNLKWYLLIISALIFGVFTGIRGGFDRQPISIVDAGLYTSPQNSAIVMNTPFMIIKSYENSYLEELKLVSESEEKKTYLSFLHQSATTFTPQNVVVLILESFAKEYTGISNRRTSYTPFFDSLMRNSLVFTNAWANGIKSIEGIPAILASMPSLMNNPYVNSLYSNNNLNSFASLLKAKHYSSAFFHGGFNSSMNFNAFASEAGFEKYFGLNEYPDQREFDGNWGIWDEPYLKYCVKKINEFNAPFFASIFTLSSHHPYKVPEKYKGEFPKGKLEIHESIGYADYALKGFFEEAKKMPWYSNTLFVLVADHTSLSDDYFYKNNIGQHTIPIAFFKGDNSMKGENKTLMQQMDIMPTVLGMLGYDLRYFSFGQDVLHHTSPRYSVFFDTGNYYLTNDSMYFGFTGFKISETYKFRYDSSMEKNVVKKYTHENEQAETYLKRFIQSYNHVLIHNEIPHSAVRR